MKAVAATTPQLLAAIARAKEKGEIGQPILVHADPASLPETRYEAENVTVRGSRSPLEIRSMLARHTDGTLVILTDCDHHELGDELVGRVAGHRIWPLDRWETIKDLFAARRLSPDLTRKPALADALIEATPLRGYRPVRSGVIDVETAVSALLRAYLKIPEDLESLSEFFRWAMRDDAPRLVAEIGQDIAPDIETMLNGRFGDGATVVLAILRKGLVGDLVPLALAGSVVHHPQASDAEGPRVRLETLLGSEIASEAWGSAGRAGAELATADGAEHLNSWTRRADALLTELKADELTYLSDLVPSGFERRMEQAAHALTAWTNEPASEERADAAHKAVRQAQAHRFASSDRTARLEMAARLIRRGMAPVAWGDRLLHASNGYRTDGAWVDYCRTSLERGDGNEQLNSLYLSLLAQANTMRASANRDFANRFGQAAAASLPDDVVGLEHVVRDVVAPIADEHRVLFVVLDGMGWPSFVDVHRTVSADGWVWWTRADGKVSRPALAILPTVTEFSRTSLFAGKVRQGDASSEQRAFSAHEALTRQSLKDKPPVIFHKRDLRGWVGASDADVQAAVADQDQRVVAVVLNNIDERLKDVALPIGGWGFDELTPLRELLNAASSCERVVIVTADHGHILDHGAEQITGVKGGGERWKPSDFELDEGEIRVSGPRVAAEASQDGVILPYVEQRHYGTRRNGYHGGITPQEVFVPLAVLSQLDMPDGWERQAFAPPAWWHHRERMEPAPAPAPTRDRRTATPSLFDEVDEPEVPEHWLDRVLDALEPRWAPSIRLTKDEVRSLLAVLDGHGTGAVSHQRLAEMTGLAAPRMAGYVAHLRQLVNIEGYGVIESHSQEARFDRALFERQPGIQ